MIALPFRSAPRIPLGDDAALPYVPWLMALLIYVAASAGIGFVMVSDALGTPQDALADRLTLLVPADASAARIQTALAALRQTPGVVTAQLLTPAETARLLEPWLGAQTPIQELPVPRLIDVAVGPGDAVDIAALRQRLTSIVPGIRLDDARRPQGDQETAGRAVQALFGCAIAAALVLAGVLAAFAARAVLTAKRPVVEVLHLLGAADRDIARPLALRALLHALLGAVGGAALVAASLAVLPRVGGLVRLQALGWGDWRLWAVLAGAALAAGSIAAATAWATVQRHLIRMP